MTKFNTSPMPPSMFLHEDVLHETDDDILERLMKVSSKEEEDIDVFTDDVLDLVDNAVAEIMLLRGQLEDKNYDS